MRIFKSFKMFANRVILLALLAGLTCIGSNFVEAASSQNRKVNGGADAAEGEFPFMVSLQMKPSFGTGYHYCGAVIYSSTMILTAAHCVYGRDISQIQVVAGAHNLTDSNEPTLQRRNITSVQYNTGFDPSTLYLDSATILLDQPFEFNSRVQPIPSPLPIDIESSLNCTFIGWGSDLPIIPAAIPAFSNNSQILQKLNMTTLPLQECQLEYQYIKPIDSTVICARTNSGGGPCTGDAGGPLICTVQNRTNMIGVLSWRMIPCTDSSYPPIFTRADNLYKRIPEGEEKLEKEEKIPIY